MAKLTAGSVYADGKMFKVGDDVPGDEATLAGLRAGGASFEGDPAPGASSLIVSTADNPIPTGPDGNSLLSEHSEAVEANKKRAEAQAAALAASTAQTGGVPGTVTAGNVTQTQTTAPAAPATISGASGGSTTSN